jgi:hypothetical protein
VVLCGGIPWSFRRISPSGQLKKRQKSALWLLFEAPVFIQQHAVYPKRRKAWVFQLFLCTLQVRIS